MARKQGHNRVSYEEKIRDMINMSLRKSLRDPRLAKISITRVELSQDYSQAKVYWDTFDTSNKRSIKEAIDGAASKLRSIIAKEMNIRHTPQLILYYDSQFEDEQNIVNLLKEDEK